jgi:hypothetical protein
MSEPQHGAHGGCIASAVRAGFVDFVLVIRFFEFRFLFIIVFFFFSLSISVAEFQNAKFMTNEQAKFLITSLMSEQKFGADTLANPYKKNSLVS